MHTSHQVEYDDVLIGLIKMRNEARRDHWVGRGPMVSGNGAGLVDGSLRENRRITVVEALEQGLEASVGEVFTKVNVLEYEAREPPTCHPGCSEAIQRVRPRSISLWA